MKELEVKILEIDREHVFALLESLGAKKVFDGEIQSFFFDFSDKRLRTNEMILRLRTSEFASFLALKRSVDRSVVNIQDELEITVSDPRVIEEIFEHIGLVKWIQMKKHRITYELNDVRFEIDKYLDDLDYIPEFVEIESSSVEQLYEYAALIGYSPEHCKRFDALELIEHYSR